MLLPLRTIIRPYNARRFNPLARDSDWGSLRAVEVTPVRKLHCLVYFPTDESRKRFQRYLEEHLPPIPNDPERFGDQVWVNAENEILGEVPYLLLSALDQSVNQIAAQARKVDALFVAAHVERPSFSLISQLGFNRPLLIFRCILNIIISKDTVSYCLFTGIWKSRLNTQPRMLITPNK